MIMQLMAGDFGEGEWSQGGDEDDLPKVGSRTVSKHPRCRDPGIVRLLMGYF